MFFDPATNTAFGCLGWVDKGALWCWDAGTGQERRIAVPDARYVSVENHGPGLIRLLHHGQNPAASIRACANPAIELASLRASSSGWRFEGDSGLWGESLALLMASASGRPDLLLIDGPLESARSLDLSWFNDVDYDRGYQGLVDCLSMPGTDLVVVSVQRSSELVLIDLIRNTKAGSIALAGRGGNPELQRLSHSTFAASDYDVLCRVDVREGLLAVSEVLQLPEAPNTAQFLGEYEFGPAFGIVARPFSGDVVRFDPTSLQVLEQASIAGQPLQACMKSDRTFVTREWKTGQVRTGAFS